MPRAGISDQVSGLDQLDGPCGLSNRDFSIPGIFLS